MRDFKHEKNEKTKMSQTISQIYDCMNNPSCNYHINIAHCALYHKPDLYFHYSDAFHANMTRNFLRSQVDKAI